jgi:hypothetical protein
MKILYALTFILLISFTAQAQPEMDLTVYVPEISSDVDLPDGGTQNSPFPIPQGTVKTFTFTIKNSGTSDLTLTKTGGFYVVLSGNAAAEVVLDESGVTPTVAAGSSVTFSVTSKSTTPPASYSLTLYIANNDSDENPYDGTVNYTITAPTGVVSAEAAGISVSPNPSSDGRININGNVVISKVVVYGLNGTSEEFTGATSFHTRQKGLLIVHVYTNKGIVAEKINVQ